MAREPLTSPWIAEFPDYLQRKIVLTVNFDNTTHAILDGVCHRDPGCLWTHIVLDVPNGPNRKPLPAVPDGDTTFTANQIRQFTGARTIDEFLAVQITAEP